jgi:hypothetical protein
MLADLASHAVTDVALQEAGQLNVVIGDAVEKSRPQRMRRTGRRCFAASLLSDVVSPVWSM